MCDTRRLYKSEGSVELEMISPKGADGNDFMANPWTEPLQVSQAVLVTHESIRIRAAWTKTYEQEGVGCIHSSWK